MAMLALAGQGLRAQPELCNGVPQQPRLLIVNVPRVPLYAMRFETETLYDCVSVNGLRYSGWSAPDGVVPLDGTIRWTSDTSSVATGWEIFWGGEAPPSPAPPPPNDLPLGITTMLSLIVGVAAVASCLLIFAAMACRR